MLTVNVPSMRSGRVDVADALACRHLQLLKHAWEVLVFAAAFGTSRTAACLFLHHCHAFHWLLYSLLKLEHSWAALVAYW